MDALLDQLGLDHTFFIELGLIAALFLFLSHTYFKPFMKLFAARYSKTVKDREAAELLMSQAQTKFEEYKRVLAEEKSAARKNYEDALAEMRKQESTLLIGAREEAKKLTQQAADAVNRQREQLKKELEADVEIIAQGISERLLSRNA